jgi:hypothetical protein
MPDTKTSALVDGATALVTDRIPVARSPFAPGDNRYIKPLYIAALLLGLGAGFTGQGQTVTDPLPLINHTQTWNDAADTMIGWRLNITDTASAAASLLIDLQVGGSSKFNINKAGVLSSGSVANFDVRYGGSGSFRVLNASGILTFFTANDIIGLGSAIDVQLARDAANTLAQRNGTAAQAFRVYNTFTDASNYERGLVGWVANLFTISTQAAGTGSSRSLHFEAVNGFDMIISASGFQFRNVSDSTVWNINSSGHLVAGTDNTFDIGASGATRPRSIYAGTNIIAGAGGQIGFSGRSNLLSSADGVLVLANAALADFGRLQFGGTTSSFPALKRSTTILQGRLADDSAFCVLQGIHRAEADAVAETPTATHTLLMQDAAGTQYKVLAVAA